MLVGEPSKIRRFGIFCPKSFVCVTVAIASVPYFPVRQAGQVINIRFCCRAPTHIPPLPGNVNKYVLPSLPHSGGG